MKRIFWLGVAALGRLRTIAPGGRGCAAFWDVGEKFKCKGGCTVSFTARTKG